MGAEYRLDVVLRIVGNGLELVYGYDAGLVGLFKIVKDFVQGGLCHFDVTNAQSPFRLSVDVKGDGAAQGNEGIKETFPYLAAFRLQ